MARTLCAQAFQAFEASRMDRVRDILTDQVPPFARATALATAITFEPLWSPSDLPAGAGQVGSVEEGLACIIEYYVIIKYY